MWFARRIQPQLRIRFHEENPAFKLTPGHGFFVYHMTFNEENDNVGRWFSLFGFLDGARAARARQAI
jgi:hypothetical protein